MALSSSSSYPCITLRDGVSMPQAGVGVYRCKPGEETVRTVVWALELGIRMVDTAAVYQNEASVAEALKNNGIPRENVFITTKIATQDHGYLAAYGAAERALANLSMGYIDLLLIHSPFGGKIVETWDALIDLQKDGLVRSIGVSNFGIPHLEAIRQAGRPMPVLNQFEMHPLIYQERKELLDYCQEHSIAITAYGSLFSGYPEFYQHPTLQEIAHCYQKKVPQVLLRWALDHGFVIIPKSSSSKERQQENFNIVDFQLTPEEIDQLDNLKAIGQEFDQYWDPIDKAAVDVGDLEFAKTIRNQKASKKGEEL